MIKNLNDWAADGEVEEIPSVIVAAGDSVSKASRDFAYAGAEDGLSQAGHAVFRLCDWLEVRSDIASILDVTTESLNVYSNERAAMDLVRWADDHTGGEVAELTGELHDAYGSQGAAAQDFRRHVLDFVWLQAFFNTLVDIEAIQSNPVDHTEMMSILQRKRV